MLIHDAVKLDKPVVFAPFVNNGGYAESLKDASKFILPADDVKPFIDELVELSQLDIIEDTRQSLCQRADGTLLQTAFPILADLRAVLVEMKKAPKELLELIDVWQVAGANEVNIDFEEKPRDF